MATNRTLETRVEKLERAAGIGEVSPPVMFVDFVGSKDGRPIKGELVGVTVNGKLLKRPTAESERAFLDRVKAEHRPLGRNALVLIAERRWPDGTT